MTSVTTSLDTNSNNVAVEEQAPQHSNNNNESEQPVMGVHQKKKMALPVMNDGGLNKIMAQAAAAKYEKDKGRIRQACAEIDNPTPKSQPQPESSCCIIL